MSYTPNTWANGDVITSAKLNNIEQGIANAGGGGGGALVVNISDDGSTLDQKAGDIWAAFQSGIVLLKGTFTESSTDVSLVAFANYEEGYGYLFAGYYGMEQPMMFEAATADAYPTRQQ